MKKKKYVLFLLALSISLILSCKAQKEIEFTQNKAYSLGNEYITFTIKNISNQDLTIIDPLLTKIEYKSNTEWRNVIILYCPCGAPCAPPPEEMIIANNETHHYRWNKNEEWCGAQLNGLKIPETFSKKANPGLYRIKIIYMINNSIRKYKYYQFKID